MAVYIIIALIVILAIILFFLLKKKKPAVPTEGVAEERPFEGSSAETTETEEKTEL